uniref:Type II antifreeze protein n=1 Tax=Osmerus mordax TaxID=8014 RepID=Q1AMR0_OSMMO|nr:type II antifreeze protein [Osmerus mordax]
MLAALLVCAMVALTRAANGDTGKEAVMTGSSGKNLTECPTDWKMFNGRCSLFNPLQLHWAHAQISCMKDGANLASIHSLEEYAFVKELTTAGLIPAWIGGSDCHVSTYWFWMDSTSMDFTDWCAAQPDFTLTECCIQINVGVGKCWNDTPCTHLHASVCAKPATVIPEVTPPSIM